MYVYQIINIDMDYCINLYMLSFVSIEEYLGWKWAEGGEGKIKLTKKSGTFERIGWRNG